MIPNSSYQLLVVFALVLPGIVFGATLQRLRGPTPEDKDASTRILRAIAVGAGLDVLYALIGGPYFISVSQASLGLAGQSRLVAMWILLLAGLIPAILACLTHIWTSWRGAPKALEFRKKLKHIRNNTYRTTPTAWDHIIKLRGDCFVRIRLSDGQFVGGWVDDRSYCSGYPEPRDIFIASQWKLNSKGEFLHKIEDTLGVYIALPDNAVVEWNSWTAPEKLGQEKEDENDDE